MPSKMTYGKRKKSILSLFPVLRDEYKSLQSPKTKAEKRVSATISMTAFYGNHKDDSIQHSPSAFDDSIEEMASMLVDDTTMNNLTGEPGNYLSKPGSAKHSSQTTHQGFFHDKAIPQLPRLSSKSEDDWTIRSRPASTATRNIPRQVDLISDEEEPDSCPPPVSRESTHARNSSAPSLPRKSSKRSRQREQKEIVEARNTMGEATRQLETRKIIKTNQQSLESTFSLSNETKTAAIAKASLDVSQQVEAMFVASKSLNIEDDILIVDSAVLSKKSRVKGNRVLSKMRNAVTGHLHDKSLRTHQNLAKNEPLLDPNLSQLPEYDEGFSTISAIELRINEGINFRNPKIRSLAGHGTVRRKPVANDGKALVSRKPVKVPALDDVNTTGEGALTNFDNRRHSIASFDQSTDCISPLPSSSYQLEDEPNRIPSSKKLRQSFEVDFDALFSSSPVAQSTPRIRLEPTFEQNGDKKLRNVPADSRSLFDPDSSMREPLSDLSINTTPPPKNPPKKMIAKRNNSQGKDVGLGVKSHMSKRRKKHPSPSKAELEGLEDALARYSPRLVSKDANTQEELTLSFGELQTGETLKSKDNNAPLSHAAKRGKQGNRLGIFGKSKQSVVGSSLAEPARRPALKMQKPSMIPKPAGAPTMNRRMESHIFQRARHSNKSAMDTDELQWDSTEYHIGMRG